jgi:hypothetical protein
MIDTDTFRQNILNKIFQVSNIKSQTESFHEISNFLSLVANTEDEEVCNLAFGDLGTKLYELVSELDYEHPEIRFGNFLSSIDEKQISNMCDYLKLCKLAKFNELSHIISIFSSNITKSICDVKSELGLLKNRQSLVRLFKRPEFRNSLRKLKKFLDKKIYELWNCNIEFSRFVRFDNFYQTELIETKNKIDYYNALGMNLLAKEMQESITQREDETVDYYGFQRTTIANCIVALAKSHNYYLDSKNSKTIIKIPASKLYDFEGRRNESTHSRINDFDYMPVIIPLHEIDMTESMRKVIGHLDTFPEADNKPVFDNFFIISCGPKFPRTNTDPLVIFDKNGIKSTFSDKLEAKKHLELTLIKEQCLTPVLLGEKDGKCYFICFWE